VRLYLRREDFLVLLRCFDRLLLCRLAVDLLPLDFNDADTFLPLLAVTEPPLPFVAKRGPTCILFRRSKECSYCVKRLLLRDDTGEKASVVATNWTQARIDSKANMILSMLVITPSCYEKA